MIIDTHCHFDMMPHPDQFISDAEKKGTILLGMTNLPSHFKMGFPHVKPFKNIRLALGFHPQAASERFEELSLFDELIDQTSYIGEIGLDFSENFYDSREIQLSALRHILQSLKNKKKIISVHSRKAEKELLDLLIEYKISNVIFHWYSGPLNLIPQIIDRGYYFSINEAMTQSVNGRKIISAIARDRILTESDAPYNTKNSIEFTLLNINMSEYDIHSNFKTLLKGLDLSQNDVLL